MAKKDSRIDRYKSLCNAVNYSIFILKDFDACMLDDWEQASWMLALENTPHLMPVVKSLLMAKCEAQSFSDIPDYLLEMDSMEKFLQSVTVAQVAYVLSNQYELDSDKLDIIFTSFKTVVAENQDKFIAVDDYIHQVREQMPADAEVVETKPAEDSPQYVPVNVLQQSLHKEYDVPATYAVDSIPSSVTGDDYSACEVVIPSEIPDVMDLSIPVESEEIITPFDFAEDLVESKTHRLLTAVEIDDPSTVRPYLIAALGQIPALVIYAPPASGKTTFNSAKLFYDTDDGVYSGKYIITNVPQWILYSKRSIAILPDKATFLQRCRYRGLRPEESWWTDAAKLCEHSTLFIKSNRYVSDLLHPP